MVRRAASGGCHAQSVMPSSVCGTGSPCFDSNRKKWQYLWMVFPRQRKYKTLQQMGPYSKRSYRRDAVPTSTRQVERRGGGRRGKRPPGGGMSRGGARHCLRFTPPPHPEMRSAECGMRNVQARSGRERTLTAIPHSAFHIPHYISKTEK